MEGEVGKQKRYLVISLFGYRIAVMAILPCRNNEITK